MSTLMIVGIGVAAWTGMNLLAAYLSKTPSLFWLCTFAPILPLLVIAGWCFVKIVGVLGVDVAQKLREGQVAAEKAAILRGIRHSGPPVN